MRASEPPRIAWLTDHFPPGRGGMATSCDRIVHGLAERGATLTVVHFDMHRAVGAGGAPWLHEREAFGARVALPAADDGAHAQRLGWTLLEREHARRPFSHVIAFGGNHALGAGPAYACWLDAPLLTLLRGNDFDLGLFQPARRSLLRDAVERSAAVCCVSAEMAARVRAWHSGARVETIANGIDLRRWQPLPSELAHAAQWRAGCVEPGRRVIGLVGDLKPKKGVLLLLETLCALGLQSRVHLLVIGQCEPAVASFLDARADTLAATRLPPLPRDALLRWYPAMDWICCPSFYDGLPNVLLEAMALGVPALVAAAGGAGELVSDGTDGVVFAAADPRALAAGLQCALQLPDETHVRMRAAAATTIAQRHDAHHESEAYMRLLASLAGDRTRVAPVVNGRGPLAAIAR